ncbi:MAG: thioredoxin [Candidatus Dormibacteraeota bacterium]|nr:thioredoxin [Candidatus Dormibacteraeota bacterium]
MADSKIVTCPQCGQRNRVRGTANGAPHCPSCGQALPWLAEAAAADFAASVEQSPIPVLVDFWAPWCGPCRMVAPAVEKLSVELAGRLKVAKVNTDEEPQLGARFGVRGIPTLILFQAGQERDRLSGALPAPALRQWVEARLP